MNNLFHSLALALAAPAQGDGATGGAGSMLVTMGILFAVFYFMLIRPQQRKEKVRRQMVEGVKTGERVIFCGGMLGVVTNTKENMLVVKIADNVKVEILRSAVIKVLEKDEKIGNEDVK